MKKPSPKDTMFNLAFALEALDQSIRATSMNDSYVGSALERSVAAALRQANANVCGTETPEKKDWCMFK